jgi:ABC-type oligopeptide transport system ATPase subunit
MCFAKKFVGPGEFFVIVGPSGSGKSSLGRLVPRLVDTCEGRLDGRFLEGIRITINNNGKRFGAIRSFPTYIYRKLVEVVNNLNNQ